MSGSEWLESIERVSQRGLSSLAALWLWCLPVLAVIGWLSIIGLVVWWFHEED